MAHVDATRRISRHSELLSKYKPEALRPPIDHDGDDDGLPPPPLTTDALDMFVLSQDALRGTKIPHDLTVGWSDRPPLFPDARSRADNTTLRHMVRRGPVPPPLRCAVWVTSVVSECNPHEPKRYAEEYGTLGMVRSAERSYGMARSRTFPVEGDEVEAVPPRFGLDEAQMESVLRESHGGGDGGRIPDGGVRSLTELLCVIHHVLGADYAPLLPDVCAVFLTHMPVSHAYLTVREMLEESSRYLPASREDHAAHCGAFADLIRRLYPDASEEMERCGVLCRSGRGLDPVFRRFFVTVFRYEHVLRIMDMYAVDGVKVLYRLASALIQTIEDKFHLGNVRDSDSYWGGVRDYVRSESFDFDALVRGAFGLHGSVGVGGGRLLRRRKFPTRRKLARMVERGRRRREEEGGLDDVQAEERGSSPVRPMRLARGGDDGGGQGMGTGSGTAGLLAGPVSVRTCLARWVPPIYRTCCLELIYSTDVHGRTLSQFYDRVRRTKRTITLIEVMTDDDARSGAPPPVIGMYASQPWRPNPNVYGDGECFLFRCSPGEPKCFKWRPEATGGGAIDDDDDEDDDDGSAASENDALMERFMVSGDAFLSMGGNRDGTSGLRLNEDLTRGESAPAVGFDNEPLAGEGRGEFHVGAMEVYRLMREVDGLAVDGEDREAVWNFDG